MTEEEPVLTGPEKRNPDLSKESHLMRNAVANYEELVSLGVDPERAATRAGVTTDSIKKYHSRQEQAARRRAGKLEPARQ